MPDGTVESAPPKIRASTGVPGFTANIPVLCSGNATALLRGETLVGSLRALLGSGCYHTSLGKLALFALLIVVVGCNGSTLRKRG